MESPLASILYSIRQPWRDRANCLGESADLFHVDGGSARDSETTQRTVDRARRICAGCGVRSECLRDTLVFEQGYTREGRKSRLLPSGVYGGVNATERWDPRVKDLPLQERVDALQALFNLTIAPRLLAPGETSGGQIVGVVRTFTWPLNDEARVWQKGTLHQVLITVRVGDEKLAKDGKRHRRLDVIGFG